MSFENIGFQIDTNADDVLTLSEALGALSAVLIVAADANEVLDFAQGKVAKGVLRAVGVYSEWIDIVGTGVNTIRKATQQLLSLDNAYATLQSSGLSTSNLRLMQMFGEALTFNAGAAEQFAIQSAAMAAQLEDSQAFVGTLFAGSSNAADMVDRLADSINNLVSGPLNDQITQAAATQASYDWLSAFPEYTEDTEELAQAMTGLEAGLKLAAASGADERTTLRGLAQTLQAFDRDADQAAQTAAQLNAIVQQGITEFPQFANRIGALSGSAATAKISLEEMAGSFAVLTRTMGTDEAMTALNNLMLTFINLSPEMRAEIEAMGVDVSETAIQNEGFINVLNNLYDAVDRDSEQFKRVIPEKQAFAAAMFLVEDSGNAAAEAIANISDTGAEGLEELFGARQVSNIARWNEVVNQAGRLVTEFGANFTPIVTIGLRAMEMFLDVIENLPGPLRFAATGLVTLLVGLQATAAASGTLISGFLRIARIIMFARLSMLAFNGTLAQMIAGKMTLTQVIFALTGTQITNTAATNANTAANAANTASTISMQGGVMGLVFSLGMLIKNMGLATISMIKYIASGKLFTAINLAMTKGLAVLATEGLMGAVKMMGTWIATQLAAQKATLGTILTNNMFTASLAKAAAALSKVLLPVGLAILAFKALKATFNAFGDVGDNFREEMEEITEATTEATEEVEKSGNFVVKFVRAFINEVKGLFTNPIQTIQNLIKDDLDPILQWLDRIESFFGFDIIPNEIVTNAQKNAADIQQAIADVGNGTSQMAADALELARQLKSGELEEGDPQVVTMMNNIGAAIERLEAQKAAIAEMNLPEDEIDKFNLQIDAQISGLEGARDRIEDYNGGLEETDEQLRNVRLRLRELQEALRFASTTGLPVERWEQLNNQLDLTPEKLNTAIELFFALRDSGTDTAEAISEVSRVLSLTDEQSAAFQTFIRDSNAARAKAIADEIELANAYDRRIDAQEDLIDELDDYTRMVDRANAALETQQELLELESGGRQLALQREASLLELQIRDRQQIIEDENTSASARRRAIRELEQLERSRKENELKSLREQQALAEQIYNSEQQQIQSQLTLEQIELRREAIKVRIAALENRAAIGVDQQALTEAERKGEIEQAAALRESLEERRDLAREYQESLDDIAVAMTDVQSNAQDQARVAAERFQQEQTARQNELLDTLSGFGTIDNEGTARERRRAARSLTQEERDLIDALYGSGNRGRRDEAVQEVLQQGLGQDTTQGEFTPAAANPIVPQGQFAPETTVRVVTPPSPAPNQQSNAQQQMTEANMRGVLSIVQAIQQTGQQIPSELGIAQALGQVLQMTNQSNPSNSQQQLPFNSARYSAVGG